MAAALLSIRTPDSRDLALLPLPLADLGHAAARRPPRAAAQRRGDGSPALVDTVAHEIRGPVTALAMSTELLADDYESMAPEQARLMLGAIHRRALYLQELVDNLLCAATIRDGRLKLHRGPLALADLLADTGSVVAPLLAEKGQRLRVRVGTRVPLVHADGRRLGQVAMNLILNASSFGGPGRAIDVVVGCRGRWVRVAVADRGPGLPAGGAQRLFEPYVRAGGAGTVGREGVGLGLSIVRAIVEAHSGRVGGQDRKGGGARFWIELPLD